MSEPSNPRPEPSAAVRREAAVWIARVHSPDRTAMVDAGLRRWLKESSEHQQAFELATELWETASQIPDGAMPRMMRWNRVSARTSPRRGKWLAAAAMALLSVIAAMFFFLRDPVVASGIGEQRTVTLKDGTRVSLNTATRMTVRIGKNKRVIELQSGEALFEPARDPQRPFSVKFGGREVTALGTVFAVRRDSLRTAVTLIDGKVVVTDRGRPWMLEPGERLTFDGDAAPALDHPKLDSVTAWQKGLVVLDKTPLAEAVDEMNRYSTVRLVAGTPQAAGVRVSGIFRAGDSPFFAQAIAQTFGLEVRQGRGQIVITGSPESAERTHP